MSHVTHLIVDHFCDGLPAHKEQQMRRHLAGCGACRREYDATALLLRAAADSEPTDAEMARWSEAVLDGPVTRPVASGPARRWPAWVVRLAPAAAAVALLLVVVGAGRLELEGGGPAVQLRGADVDPPGENVMVDFEVFAARVQSGRASTPRRVAAGGRIALNEYIQLRVLNPNPRLGRLYLVALDQRLRPLDYYPRPSEPRSVAVKPAGHPVSVGRSIRLAKRHRVGPLWIVALFSQQPLSRGQVHSALTSLALRGVPPTGQPDLGLGDTVHSVLRRYMLVQEAP